MQKTLLLLAISIFIFSCGSNKKKSTSEIKPLVETKVTHPDWAKDAVIYEVNIRQYTPEGTFEAFIPHISRLKDLGVDILWLMPIFPIGEKNRKGELGSYYSVQDYKAINPDYGTSEDFKNLVQVAHENGLKVILDWVANHTAWDNAWIKSHPEYYEKDSTGNFFGPFDWTDVAQLSYDNKDLYAAMQDAMEFWVRESDIDGYRCDVAGMVPQDFWEQARKTLDGIKPVFMLAENEDVPTLLHKAFDMNYGWELHHIMNQVAKGNMDVTDLKKYFAKEDSLYSKDCYRMQFITNHDENSWNGTEFERMGDGANTFAVMTFTIPGMPLIYTGQEVGMDKRLEFFVKDTVIYAENEYPAFYQSLIGLKKNNKVLWNGAEGGDFEIVDATNNKVFAFKRFTDETDLFVILNLSGEAQNFTVPAGINGAYTDYFSKGSIVLSEGEEKTLNAWSYQVLIEK